MDFTILGGLVGTLLAAIPLITAYYSRQSRAQRRELQRHRALVQEFEVHVFTLERRGWTSRGERPPPRPALLRALEEPDEPHDLASGPDPTPEGPDPGTDESTGGGARHRAR